MRLGQYCQLKQTTLGCASHLFPRIAEKRRRKCQISLEGLPPTFPFKSSLLIKILENIWRASVVEDRSILSFKQRCGSLKGKSLLTLGYERYKQEKQLNWSRWSKSKICPEMPTMSVKASHHHNVLAQYQLFGQRRGFGFRIFMGAAAGRLPVRLQRRFR